MKIRIIFPVLFLLLFCDCGKTKTTVIDYWELISAKIDGDHLSVSLSVRSHTEPRNEHLVYLLFPPSKDFIIDIADPTHPIIIEKLKTEKYILKKQLKPDLFYNFDSIAVEPADDNLSSYQPLINFYDNDSPDKSNPFSTIDLHGKYQSHFLNDDYLFVQSSDVIDIIGLQNNKPELISNFSCYAGFSLPIREKIFHDNRLFLIDNKIEQAPKVSQKNQYVKKKMQSTFRSVDLTDIKNPTVSGSLSFPDWFYNIEISSDRAYLATDEKLEIIDISDANKPLSLKTYEPTDFIFDFKLKDNLVFLANNHLGLQILDCSDSQNPRTIGSWRSNKPVILVDVKGNYAYVVDSVSNVTVLNITNPNNPVKTGSIQILEPKYKHVIARQPYETIKGVTYKGYFYKPFYSGFAVYKKTDLEFPDIHPDSVSMECFYSFNSRIEDIDICGKHACVATANHGFRIYDLSNPARPEPVYSNIKYKYIRSAKFADNRLFIQAKRYIPFENNRSKGEEKQFLDTISVLDFSNPNLPVEMFSLEYNNLSNEIIIQNDQTILRIPDLHCKEINIRDNIMYLLGNDDYVRMIEIQNISELSISEPFDKKAVNSEAFTQPHLTYESPYSWFSLRDAPGSSRYSDHIFKGDRVTEFPDKQIYRNPYLYGLDY